MVRWRIMDSGYTYICIHFTLPIQRRCRHHVCHCQIGNFKPTIEYLAKYFFVQNGEYFERVPLQEIPTIHTL